jgi:hypothetical protein
MSQTPDHDPRQSDDESTHADQEYGMPCAEALLAGTPALMTGHAQACCEDQRTRMAEKTGANLALLARHPRLSAGFRAMVTNLRAHWPAANCAGPVQPVSVADDAAASTSQHTGVEGSDAGRGACSPVHQPAMFSDQPRALWHTTPEVIQ